MPYLHNSARSSPSITWWHRIFIHSMSLAKTQRSRTKNILLREGILLLFCFYAFATLQLLLWSGRGVIDESSSLPPIPFPPTIDICNVTQLAFDETKMTMDPKHIYRAHIPANASYAYGPWITKSGSTSMVKSLQYATKDLASLSINDMSEESLDRYNFISVLRHPLERALAGFHQIEVFWNKNWIDSMIHEKGLTWWNKTCLNSTWALLTEVVQSNPCMGSNSQTTTERRLKRLNDFLDEIDEKGFWDQHVMPMTYLIASNRAGQRARYFDIKYVNTLTTIMAQSTGRQPFFEFIYQQRGGIHNGMDWVFRWKELVDLAPRFELASSAIEKLCRLYRNDVECLPYDVPECQSHI